MNYEGLRDLPQAIAESPPELVVADEIHRLRNLTAQVTQGARIFKTGRLWGLTGTPIERDPKDIAVIMSLIAPGRFSVRDADDPTYALKESIRPYFLRRRRSEVATHLPTLVDHHERIDLSPHQREEYRVALEGYAREPRRNQLAVFTRLRTVCDLASDAKHSSKLDHIIGLLSSIREGGEKAVVFSYRIAPLRALSIRLRQDCGAHDHELVDGSMAVIDRGRAIGRFKDDPGCNCLLLSQMVGGEGLTLIEANHVIFVNRWWNPSANNQARDRVYRLGQEKPVHVYTFSCLNTVEERLEALLESKSLTFDELFNPDGKLAHNIDGIL